MNITRLLIANRGEIAVRIIRACDELGMESVAVCSTADIAAPHAKSADHVVTIGPPVPKESYLNIGAIIDAARAIGADAIHPGYGFLSEAPEMAAACDDAGLVWVGPPADVIARLGSKIEARRLMQRAGVPVVEGETPVDQTPAGLRDAAERLGYPLLVKASAGGGGRGMRAVESSHQLTDAIDTARREATAAFGDGTLYVERWLQSSRHIEVQVMADHTDQVVHLFERDCSLQRRHQKVIEESPAPNLAPTIRERLTTAAVKAAQAAGYRNAGTVEFLVDGHDSTATIAFLEMNTRLQVEHPVTEVVTGRDLVHTQLAVASGAPLPWTQEQITLRGHAIECRIYAERPAEAFLPDTGTLIGYHEPTGPGIRIDTGVEEGGYVSSAYDGLLSKLVVSSDTRLGALTRMRAALARYVVLGVRTNIGLLSQLVQHPRVVDGRVHTSFLESELETLLAATDTNNATAALAVAVALAVDTHQYQSPNTGPSPVARGQTFDPWDTLSGWRLQ